MLMNALYTGTPTLSVRDNRGLVVRTLNYNRRAAGDSLTTLTERHLVSDDSRHSQQWDARLFRLWQGDETVLPNVHTQPSLAGQALRSDSADAGWSVALFDAAGRIVWAEDGRDTRSRTEFDLLGRPRAAYLQASVEAERVAERYIYGDTDSSMSDPASYNARGQLVRYYHDAGLQAAPSYSLQGAALHEQCQLLPSAEAISNWQGENESAWQDELAPQVYTTTHEYDAQGGALAQTDARGNRQRWSYDVAGLLNQAFLTLSGDSEQILLKQQSWSAAGQKLQETAGNDVVTTYSYEPQTQRLVRIEARRADLSVLQDLSYGYDPVGNVIWQENAAVATRYFANQAVKARNDFQYDALYQLMSASGRENANAGIQEPALPEAMPDTSNLVNYTRSYSYDDGGNLLHIQHTGALSYSNEMVVGSRSNRALAQDSNSPITPEQVDNYFDPNGNVLRMQPGTPLGWNERNQLQQVVLVDRGTEQDNDREVYQYRQGLRVRKQTRRLLDSTSQRWDIAEVIYLPGLELRSRYVEQAGQPQTPSEELHVATPAQGGRAQVRVLHWVAGKPTDIANDQVRYGLGDQIGSLQLELDSSGLVISQEEYYPFGGTAVLAARSATEVAYKVVRYSGKERDGTGLYYYGYRYYAPWLGRWLNPDPAGQVDGLNVYRMVRNNPATLNDEDGLMPLTPKKTLDGQDIKEQPTPPASTAHNIEKKNSKKTERRRRVFSSEEVSQAFEALELNSPNKIEEPLVAASLARESSRDLSVNLADNMSEQHVDFSEENLGATAGNIRRKKIRRTFSEDEKKSAMSKFKYGDFKEHIEVIPGQFLASIDVEHSELKGIGMNVDEKVESNPKSPKTILLDGVEMSLASAEAMATNFLKNAVKRKARDDKGWSRSGTLRIIGRAALVGHENDVEGYIEFSQKIAGQIISGVIAEAEFIDELEYYMQQYKNK